MTRDELTTVLTKPFRSDFAAREARRVVAEEAVALLYELATEPPATLPQVLRERTAFRAAYILEYIYFHAPEQFAPYCDRFIRQDFAHCAAGGARRHFAKIMAHLLPATELAESTLERIANAAAWWAIDPKAKVAVQIWCVEILQQCRTRCDWVEDLWEDLLANLSAKASPAIAARMRNSWSKSLK